MSRRPEGTGGRATRPYASNSMAMELDHRIVPVNDVVASVDFFVRILAATTKGNARLLGRPGYAQAHAPARAPGHRRGLAPRFRDIPRGVRRRVRPGAGCRHRLRRLVPRSGSSMRSRTSTAVRSAWGANGSAGEALTSTRCART